LRFEDLQLQANLQRSVSRLSKATRELKVERLAIEQEQRRLAGRLTEASARADAAKAQVEAARSQADDAGGKYELRKSLAKDGMISQEELRGAEAKAGVPRFLDLVQSLQMGAMVGLGLLQGPDGKRPPVDLPGAKDAIDLLGILQEKTKGNLTKEEEEVLREGLYHLRMGYMAMINAPPAGRNKGGEQR